MKAITDFFIKYAMVLAGLAITGFGVMAFITISSVKEVKGRGYSFDHGLAKQMRKEQGK